MRNCASHIMVIFKGDVFPDNHVKGHQIGAFQIKFESILNNWDENDVESNWNVAKTQT